MSDSVHKNGKSYHMRSRRKKIEVIRVSCGNFPLTDVSSSRRFTFKDETLQLDKGKKQSRFFKNHLRGDTGNQLGILCLKIKN